MSDGECALAAETRVETPEGAMAIRSVAGKAIAVFSREPSGRVRFRLMLNVRKIAEQQPVLKITLENAQSFRVGAKQILFKKGMIECRADQLKPGDELESTFHYPDGYRFRDDVDAGERESRGGLQVTKVEADGSADIYSLSVNQTGDFFVTAGVLCKAEAPALDVAAATGAAPAS